MKTVALIIGKITIFFGNILKRGSSLPGKLALKVDKNLLKKLTYPEVKIFVTGSSGKGSTSKLIAEVLKDNNESVCYNSEGSNLSWGITTALLRNSNLFGTIKTKYLVIEIDERYTKEVLGYIKPDYLIITNLTKDQPPRQTDVDTVYKDILTSLKNTPKTTIVTNMDDPYLRNFEKDLPNPNLYFSLSKNEYSYKNQIFENLNIYFCPYCHTKLDYEYYNFETLGKYNCPNCDFEYIKPKITAQNLNLDKQSLEVNNNELQIGGNMLFHAYNTLAAYTVLAATNIPHENIINSINKLNKIQSKEFITNDITFIGMSTKAENATTYNAAIFKTLKDIRKKDIIIGWKEISRRYKHFDISWLYDCEFELLNNQNLNKIYACGIDHQNIKKRLILAGIKEEKIICSNSIADIKEEVLNDQIEVVYGILNFDYIPPFNETFKENEND